MSLEIARRAAGADCTSILAELPEWFGIPESNADYAAHAEQAPTWVAEDAGEALGLITLVDPGFAALEIYLLAVRPHVHRRGVGLTLIRQACSVARELGKPYLTVKTQGPSAGYEPYERTRAFYEAVGFQSLEELTAIWGPENPCLIMIMRTPGEGEGIRDQPIPLVPLDLNLG
ncbi:MAG TPA: GNAT family N-acetyltransferase [Caulobacteraceae bacterium]|jgi:N-acetylglutamate synthase-like GNAT family acetyltransferase|nr:GNAT family N-acetyltransferase [Caulobacteraceae bacterium]